MIDLPKGVDLKDLLLFLKNIGLKCSSTLKDFENGSIPLYEHPENLPINYDANAPVTAADLAINKLIYDAFLLKYSNIDWEIVTEENVKDIQNKDFKSDWIWLIDPLDGTKDFIQNTGEYAVHVALIFKNKPLLGMVVLPSLGEIWFGVDGYGTWQEEGQNSLENNNFLTFSKTEVSNIVCSKNHGNQKLNFILKRIEHKKIVKMGSIGFKICSLLRNETDLYISISGRTSPKDWDIAAPHAIMKSAKFNFTYVSGKEISYLKDNYEQPGCLIASTLQKNEHISVCKKINSIMKEFNL